MQFKTEKLTAALFICLALISGSVLAADVYISEFMASNSSTSLDEFNEASDWIEIYNDSSQSINLSGWSLTDNPTHLTKWSFPSVTLGSKDYLVVRASGRDTVQNGELHTSFKLDGDGEYLALVQPDGSTVEHEFAPVYPNQKKDVSYGILLAGNGNQITLSDTQTACTYHVPTSNIGTNWKTAAFDDSGWTSGFTAIGFDRGSNPKYDEYNITDIESEMYGVSASLYLRIPFVVDDPADLESFSISMRYDDGCAVYLNGMPVASDNIPSWMTAETLTWNAIAPGSRNESQAVVFTDLYTGTDPVNELIPGTNMLCVQGLNQSVNGGDLMMQTQILGTLKEEVSVTDNRYFSTPTPGAANSGSALGFVKDTEFSVDRGYHTTAFDLVISSATAGATIRYTLDGSTPSEVSGMIYTAPIPISGTAVVRAIAYRSGWESSDVDTQTYIFADQVTAQPAAPAGWPSSWTGGYSDYEMDPDIIDDPDYEYEFPAVFERIPTLSIVTDQDNLFGSSGVYDNSTREGVAWERPASAELIYPDDSKGFQVNCGLRIQGGASRIASRSPKHSFRLLFKDIYGPTKLRHDLFPDSPVDTFDTVILRAGYNRSWIHMSEGQRISAQYTRDWFARNTQIDMGHAGSHGTMVHLYINGLYWGIYNPSERPTAGFTSQYLGGEKEDWDTLNAGEIKDGDFAAWNAMFAIGTNGLASLSDYQDFMDYCDVVNLADYMIINHYIGNADWDHKNWYAGRRRRAGEGYKFFCWDGENSVGSETANNTGKNNSANPTALFQGARDNAEFRLMFADRLHQHFFNDGTLTPANAAARWSGISSVIDGIAVAESARWGDYRTPDAPYTVNDHYLVEQTRILNSFFPVRTGIVLDQYRSMGLYPDLDAPELNKHGGIFTNSMEVGLSGPTNIYYTLDGTDPREFGTGNVAGTLYSGTITLDRSTRVKARCFDGSIWSALTEAEFYDLSPSALRISEVMYAPRLPDIGEIPVSGDASDYQFIELYNSGAETIGLIGMELVEGVRFNFSKGAVETLAPGEFVLIVKDRAAFFARYPGLEAAIAGEFIGDLSDDGEQVKLQAADRVNVVSFTYGDGREWPLAADGAGHSLVPVDAASGENLNYGPNWRASVRVDGSPGTAEPVAETGLCLNEITGHTDLSDPAYPDYDSNDWIELFNAGTTTVSLTGYYLSDDPYDLLKWAVPSGLQVAPGAFVVFDEVSGFHAPISSGFGINKAGEQILLTYAPGGTVQGVVDSHSFKGQENGVSIGRYPDGADYWVPTVPTLGTTNAPNGLHVVISEIMYHPVEEGGTNENANLEYIELYNPTASAVQLWSLDGTNQLGSWRIRGDVDYSFPGNMTLAAEQRVLVVPFDPTNVVLSADFNIRYGLDGSVVLFGPYDGKLSNQEGRITLEKPQAPDAFDESIFWVIVDELIFSEASPWMPAADGLGYALHRMSAESAAADPGSWKDGMPSPGGALVDQPDLRILSFGVSGGQTVFEFKLLPGTTYALEYCTNLVNGSWMPDVMLENQTNYIAPAAPGAASLYYRLQR